MVLKEMKRLLLSLVFCLLSVEVWAQTTSLEAYWDEGLRFRSADDKYKLRVGGRVHYDIAFLNQTEKLDTLFGHLGDRMEIRRARLGFSGELNKFLEYEFEFTFGEVVRFSDMFFVFLRAPFLDRLTLGHFREPFGMEEQTSSNDIVFLERSLTSAFGTGRNTGIMGQKLFRDGEVALYSGIFRVTDDFGADRQGQGKHSFTSRVVYNPLLDAPNNRAAHLGVAFNAHSPLDNTYEVKAENETNTGVRYVQTRNLPNVRNVRKVSAEAGFSEGRLVVHGEFASAFARLDKITDRLINDNLREFNSHYVLASYFLKGGTRQYSRSKYNFSSFSFAERPQRGSTVGAWELALRYSNIYLKDSAEDFRKMTDLTLGLNWYFNTSSRIMMNYIHTILGQKDHVNTLQFRVQVAF